MTTNIAIDGPAGAGKSTVAKMTAARLSFIYVDTGAMYRAMALHLLNHKISMEDPEAIACACLDARISIQFTDGQQQVLLNDQNVTALLRTEEVGTMASVSSPNPKVREKLIALQRELAARENVVMDGRDIGTVVLPFAAIKIYLTADVKTRANRRYLELLNQGLPADLDAISKDIADRDYRDMHREISPLVQAEDAIYLDSSNMTPEEVTDFIIACYEKDRKDH